jgi:hypothetical protein
VLDPETLMVRNRFSVPGLIPPTDFATGADTNFAYVIGGVNDPDTLLKMDLRRGDVREYPAKGFGLRAGASFKTPMMTPDGKTLFTSGLQCIQGYRIDGDSLILAASSEGLSNTASICLSPDGKRVCLPAGGGNGGPGYTTYIYDATSLIRPEMVLRTGAYPRVVGFDPAAEFIYAQNAETSLLVFDTAGQLRGAYNFTDRGDETNVLVASPAGWRLFMASGNRSGIVELPR